MKKKVFIETKNISLLFQHIQFPKMNMMDRLQNKVLCKLGHFGREKLVFKMLSVSLLKIMSTEMVWIFFKEVLRVSVGQRIAKLQVVKLEI